DDGGRRRRLLAPGQRHAVRRAEPAAGHAGGAAQHLLLRAPAVRAPGHLHRHAAPRLEAEPVAGRPRRRLARGGAPGGGGAAAPARRELAAENPDLLAALRKQTVPSSVDLLAPDTPALQLIAHRPVPPSVHYHSVIGVSPDRVLLLERLFGGGYCHPSDGV